MQAEAIYAVFYENKPINLKTINSLKNDPAPKYGKSAFGNAGHAFNLAEKLNKLFKTNKFKVIKLTQGEVIDEKGSGE